MAVIVIGNLNGANLERDHGLSMDAIMNMQAGVRKGFSGECEVTTNLVSPGVVWVEALRTSVSPNETFLVPVWIDANVVIDTSGTNKVFVEVDPTKIIDGSGNAADGTGIASVTVAASVPSANALELASITGGSITDTRVYAQHTQNILSDTVHFGIDTGTDNAKVVNITGIKSLVDGAKFSFKSLLANTGAVTLAITGLAAKAIVKNFDVALIADDIKALQVVGVIYNASADNFEMFSQPGNSSTPLLTASIAETNTGTDASKAVTPDGLAGSYAGIKNVQVIPIGFTEDTVVGDGQYFIRIPEELDGMDLIAVHAEVITAGTTGTTDIQVHNVNGAVNMLSTILTVDSGETGSDTAAVPAVIDTANDDVSTNDIIRIDMDAIAATPAKGWIMSLAFKLP